MSESFLGEVHLVAFTYAPEGWALCNGQTLPIKQNEPLFTLIGTTFGGNGTSDFGLPNLIGTVPLGYDPGGGAGFQMGQTGGQAISSIGPNNLPAHSHSIEIDASDVSGLAGCSVPACSAPAANTVFSTPGPTMVLSQAEDPNIGIQIPFYCLTGANTALKGFEVKLKGHLSTSLNATEYSGYLHQIDSRMPFIVMNYVICTQGIYPSKP